MCLWYCLKKWQASHLTRTFLENWRSGPTVATGASLAIHCSCSCTARCRFFLVFRFDHGSQLPTQPLPDTAWMPKPRLTVCDMDAYFEFLLLPLRRPFEITPEVLPLYMSAALCPPDLRDQSQAQISKYRARPPTAPAECFLAQYHYQHRLPPSLLQTRGILSSLLQTPSGICFFASPEIASQHGAVAWHFIPSSDREAMRFLGNALAVQQAAMIMSTACS